MNMKRGNIVGDNINRLRTAAGLTQEELAFKSGLSQGYINQVENGKRRFTQKSLELIAKALSVPIIELLKEEKPFEEPVVREEEATYGKKPVQVKEFSALLKQLPQHVIEHYFHLLRTEVELRKKRKC